MSKKHAKQRETTTIVVSGIYNNVKQMATDHRWCSRPRIKGFAIKKCVNDVNSIFESPDVQNLPIMKIILNNEKFMR